MSQTQIPTATVRLMRGANEVGEVNGLTGPNFTLGVEDSTALNELWDSVVPTINSGGEVTFDLGFKVRDAEHGFGGASNSGLGSDLTSKTLTTFTLFVPGATAGDMMLSWSFSAYVTSLVPTFNNPGKITASLTLRIVGTPTLS